MALLAAHLGDGDAGRLLGVWVAFVVVFMGSRAVVLLARARGDAWMVTGAGGTGR